jgi:hypothetical protein
MNYYYFNGLNIESEIGIIPLIVTKQSKADVFIRLGKVPETLEQPIKQTATFVINHNSALILLPNLGRFLIENGTHISVEPTQNCPLGDLSPFITGVAWAALSYQRNQCLLKGTLIELNRQVWLISGLSPVGSSTFALAMQTYLGANVISDEFCRYHLCEQDIIVEPGIPALKLWHQTLAHFHLDTQPLARVREKLNKYWLPLSPSEVSQKYPLKLHGIIGMQEWRSDDLSKVGIKQLTGFKALKKVYQHGFHRAYLYGTNNRQRNFQQDLQFVQQCEILSFSFKREFKSLQNSCELLSRLITK